MNKNRLIIVAISLSLLVFIFLVCVAIFGVYIFLTPSNENTEIKLNDYKITSANIFEDVHEHGIVTIPESLKREEYISYIQEETGTSFIISHFGGTDYKCTGSCECEYYQLGSRRVTLSPHILTRGLVLVLSAFSVPMAIKIAEQTFHDQCEYQYSDVCQAVDIKSAVDKCNADEEAEKGDSSSTNGDEKTTKKDFEDYDQKYLCKGHCINNEAFDSYPESFKEELNRVGYDKIGLCEGMTFEREMEISTKQLEAVRAERSLLDFDGNLHLKYKNYEEAVTVIFALAELGDFCEQNSMIKETWFSDESKRMLEEILKLGKKDMTMEKETGSWMPMDELEKFVKTMRFCVGSKVKGLRAELEFVVDNVKCVKT